MLLSNSAVGQYPAEDHVETDAEESDSQYRQFSSEQEDQSEPNGKDSDFREQNQRPEADG